MKKLFLFLYLIPTLGFGLQNTYINQANIFSGEVASNLTKGAPLIVSSTGTVTTGITFTELSYSSAITTTSATNVVMTGLTTTPAAGTYLVTFSTWLTNTTGNQTASISIFVGGSQVASTLRKGAPFNGAVGSANDGMPFATNAVVTVNGSQAIAMEWSTTGGTVSSANATMDVIRIQ